MIGNKRVFKFITSLPKDYEIKLAQVKDKVVAVAIYKGATHPAKLFIDGKWENL